jgi:hypothetical protein
MGDPGQIGARGERGERGEKGKSAYTPLIVRHATAAYAILLVGVIVSLLLSANLSRADRERDAEVMLKFEQEVIATDRAFCTFFNAITESGLNPNREAIRSLASAVRQSFELVQAGDGSTPEQRRRTDEFRNKILAQIDQVQLNGGFPPLDCSAIGNGSVDFSLQDAITKATATTSIP